MRTNRIYYGLKPYLPWRLRMGLRRVLARWKRKAYQDVWPIKESAGNRPAEWAGWPEGKRFALVLTHDVEGARGLAKCRQLMQLEKQMGFRSSFNFVPEAIDYDVSWAFMEELRHEGFEVGVQDLKHDGKLFQSRENFRDGAVRINRYLRAWEARGFRSGFMFHNLDWVHDLDVDYSSCTFDTDPFEPQPDDVGTIFPFWVPRRTAHNGRSGYVELPYTLPQDSTLFLLLQEEGPEIWMRKLHWIAERGGMVLLNTHPDYMAMNGDSSASGEYPIEFYKRFLDYIKSNYGGLYWQALPAQVANYVYCNKNGSMGIGKLEWVERETAIAGHVLISAEANGSNGKHLTSAVGWGGSASADAAKTIESRRHEVAAKERMGSTQDVSSTDGKLFDGNRAAVVLFSKYPADPRPRRAAEALARQGMIVDVFCLQGGPEEAKHEIVDGVNVFRLPLKRRRGGKAAYIFQYSAFIFAAFAFLSRRSLRGRYDLVHVHNMPDVLVFSALVPKLLGAKIILDLHDPMPELMVTIFGMREDSFAVRMLKLAEKWSIGFADMVLTPNKAFERLFISRSCPAGKIQIIMNSPAEEIFHFQPVRPSAPGLDPARPFTILYHGSLVARHGLDMAIDALQEVRKSVPTAVIVICGENTSYFEGVMASIRERSLEKTVRYLGPKNLSQIVEVIEGCDLGIIPNRRSIFTEINMPTRIFEYLVLAKPVVAPRTRGIQDYFGEEDIFFFEPDDAADLAKKIVFAATHPETARATVERGQAIYRRHRWIQEKAKFIDWTDGVLDSAPR